MVTLLVILISLVMGFFAAIPVGAIQIEVIKRSLHQRLRAAYMVVLGAFVADIVYGFVAFFGIAPLLEHPTVLAVFKLASGLLLLALSIFTLRNSGKVHIGSIQHTILKSKRLSLVTGVSLGLTNPMMIFWWLIAGKIVIEFGILRKFSPHYAVLFIISGATGLATYLIVLALIITWANKFISPHFMRRINLVLGILLSGLAAYFMFTALRVLL